MILLEQMKNMKIYKRPLFLPTVENDKKHRAAIMLLTPNYNSSKQLMNHPLLINKLRYQSYYKEQDVSFYIDGKVSKKLINEEYIINETDEELYQHIAEMSAAERNKLKDSQFGLPDKRKYPLMDQQHVRSAIKFFNYVDKADEEELARNIKKALKKFNMNVNVGANNRFSKYYATEAVTESADEGVYNKPGDPVKICSVIIEKYDTMFAVVLNDRNQYRLPGPSISYGKDEDPKEIIINYLEKEFAIKNAEVEIYAVLEYTDQHVYKEEVVYSIKDFGSTDTINDNAITWFDIDKFDTISEDKISRELKEYIAIRQKNMNDFSQSIVDSLNSFIYFSGYAEDINHVRKIITPTVYYNILTNQLHLPIKSITDLPVLHIEVTRDAEEIGTLPPRFDYKENCNRTFAIVPSYKLGDLKSYILDVLRIVYYAILQTRFNLETTHNVFAKILVDYFTEADTIYGEYGRYLFDSEDSWTLAMYREVMANDDLGSLHEKLAKIYPNLKLSELADIKYDLTCGKYEPSNSRPDAHNPMETLPVVVPDKKVEESVYESYIFEENKASYEEDSLRMGNIVTFFNEAGKFDSELRRLLFKERIKLRSELIEMYKQVKIDNPWIKYAYPDIAKYNAKNLFVDLHYYNELFFKNNVWKLNRGYSLYLELMSRLLNDPRIAKAGYEKKTVFIPVLDWANNPNTKMWMFRESINPISIIFNMMKTNSTDIKKLFKGVDIVFFAPTCFFKMDISQIEDLPKETMKFRRFLTTIMKGQEFDQDDVEDSPKETPEVIKANIIDKIEDAKGVDISTNFKKTPVVQKPSTKNTKPAPAVVVGTKKEIKVAEKEKPVKVDEPKLSNTLDRKALEKEQKDLDALAAEIQNIANHAIDTDDALDKMDDMDSIKQSLIDIESSKSDSVKINATRASRMNKLDKEFLYKDIKGTTVKELLDPKNINKDLETSELKIASPNPEWKNMKYMNFDKDYNLEKDIVNCFYHFTKVSKPIAIRNIDIKDNSTSEDYLDLYTVEMEDFRGKRFSVRLDIPKMQDNRFMLRGNAKTIQTQLFNMPIIKTNLDTCQIVTNYQKIFIYRVNTVAGRSTPKAGRFLKTATKYKGNAVKVITGDNSRICDKYELPIDYIDLASVLHMIETDNYIIYFNQDEIRNKYKDLIREEDGVPYAYNKKLKAVLYINSIDKGSSVVDSMLSLIGNEEFANLYRTQKPSTSGTYSRCNIMNEKIPMIIVLGYLEGLTNVLKKAGIEFIIKEKLTGYEKADADYDYIRFEDAYLYFRVSYPACMLLNGFKECSTLLHSIAEIDEKGMYLEFLDNYGGKIKSDGLDNFYDCLVDPMTYECLKHYNLPTDFTDILLYANALLCDNKFIKHTDTTSRRIRRNELVAAYTYEALSAAYGEYANMIKHGRQSAEFNVKQSAVIDKILLSPVSSDSSVINALNAVETTNAITFKGKSGLNSDRSYSLDKRTYDDSMLNILGMSTGFSGNVGITRQATVDMNIEGERGYIKSIDGDTNQMNAAKSLCATEALTPFGTTKDDPPRTYMTFVQTAKHSMRTEDSDPLLITNGIDEAMPYLTIDKFAYKAKSNGKVTEVTDDYIVVDYGKNGKDFINLDETIEKNSDAGFYVPLKLSKMNNIKEGSRVTKGQVLAYDKYSFSNKLGESDNLAYNIGKLVKVAIINTDDGFEDAGICSESLSKKLASRIVRKEDHVLDKESNVIKMLKVGDHVEVDDALIVWEDPHEDEEADVVTRLISADNSDVISELGRKTIKSELSGTIVDIKIYRTVEIADLSPSLQKIVKAYEAPIKERKKKMEAAGVSSSSLPATYKLEPTGKLKKAQDAVYIEFFIEYLDSVAMGDKIVYFTANKAVIKNILSKDKCPYTDFRPNEPIDAFVSTLSIEKRQVTSTLINGSINKLLVELDRTCKDILGIKYDDSTV